jgi:hypothetical protein
MSWIVSSVWCQIANPSEQLCLFDIESLKGSARSVLQCVESFFCSGVAKQWIRKTVTGERVQITSVQLAAEARSTREASEIGIDCVFVPADELCVMGTYRDAVKVPNFLEGNISLWDNNSSWKERTLGTGAQNKLVYQAKHRPTRLIVVNYVVGHAPALELPIRIDEE